MRTKHVATALVVIAAGVTATAALRWFVGRRRTAVSAPSVTRPAETRPGTVVAGRQPAPQQDAVVLRFTPRAAAAPAPERPAGPVRCGDTGGRTKAGAPCAARGTTGGRCHHHKLAG